MNTIQSAQEVSILEEAVSAQCHIHKESIYNHIADVIRKNVCVHTSEHPLTEFEGKYYCLFHLPSKEKDGEKFYKLFASRLNAVESIFVDTEYFSTDKQELDQSKIRHDFRYVWFPVSLDLAHIKFSTVVDFSAATFSDFADFRGATFSADTNFSFATFTNFANFNLTTFSDYSAFVSTKFSANASFHQAKFSTNADFREAKFSYIAHFISAEFSDYVSFDSAKFLNVADFESVKFSAVTYFSLAKFSGHANFGLAKFPGETSFASAKFLDVAKFNSATFLDVAIFDSVTFLDKAFFNSATFSANTTFSLATFSSEANFNFGTFGKQSQITFNSATFRAPVYFYKAMFDGYAEFHSTVFETVLDFQEARFKNPEQISFKLTTLRLNWFANLDNLRRVIFYHIKWQNTDVDIDCSGIDDEIESLRKRKIDPPEEALRRVCNQLVDNSEANRRFDDAKKFRKLAIAIDRRKCNIGDAVYSEDKDAIRGKVCREYPAVNEDGGNYYCLLHNPDKSKAEIFHKEFDELKKTQTDFRGVHFPIALRFWDELPDKLDFSFAVFQRDVVFQKAIIKDIHFYKAYFCKESDLIFEDSVCKGQISFNKAVFDGKLFLNGEKTLSDGKKTHNFFEFGDNALNLKEARFDKPSLINFRLVQLRPHYFVDVDCSKFVFHDCDWNASGGITKELACCSKKSLAQVCNQLAINYEESRDYERSSYFRRMAMEAIKREYWFEGRFWTVIFYYKWTSGYGESSLWATFVLIALLLSFGTLYGTPISSFERAETKQVEAAQNANPLSAEVTVEPAKYQKMNLFDGFVHSLYVAALQRPEPKPYDFLTRLLVILETIFVPLQAALLALAMRRKFMR